MNDLRSLKKNPGFVLIADGGGPMAFGAIVSMPELITERDVNDSLSWTIHFPRTYDAEDVANAIADNLEQEHGLVVAVWDLRENDFGDGAVEPDKVSA